MKLKLKKDLLLAAKIGIGASAAIYFAEFLQLQYATSAGIITMLTLITTRWGTFRLSGQRVLTYGMSVIVCWAVFRISPSVWIGYGTFLFVMVLVTEWLGWKSTLSTNAVIGSHFLVTQDFSRTFIGNEFMLVGIGITIAILLNLFHINSAHEHGIIRRMRKVEKTLKDILIELAGYLLKKERDDSVWEHLTQLEVDLEESVDLAYEYHYNTFHSYQDYYATYFEMRMKQCSALHNLHAEMQRIRKIPKRANIIAEFILDIVPYVTEMNHPKKQLQELHTLLEEFRKEPLPTTHEEFENRAELYHILMDLEEFILYKKKFVEEIDETQFRVYWKKEIAYAILNGKSDETKDGEMR